MKSVPYGRPGAVTHASRLCFPGTTNRTEQLTFRLVAMTFTPLPQGPLFQAVSTLISVT